MAEIGIIASVIQIADVGLRLSLRLYTFGETIASADETISSISKDISLTSSVLKELGCNLEKDKELQICSETAIKTAEDIVQECLKVFLEIDATLEKTVASTRSDGEPMPKWTTVVVRKLRWPFLQPKMQLLRSNLDKLKATLLLMLNVMTYARQLTERTQSDQQLEDHRKLIEDLARSKEEYTRKFDVLTRAIMGQSSSGNVAQHQASTFFAGAQEPPDRFPTSPRQDESSRVFYELKTYGELINRLLKNIQTVEHYLEPLLGARIRDDLVLTHRRETRRFQSLHGRSYLKKAIDGVAWDVIESELQIQGEQVDALPTSNNRALSISSNVAYSPSLEGGLDVLEMASVDSDPMDFIGFEVCEGDNLLPVAKVARTMKDALPEDAKISKDAKECMQECVSEFISFITSEAADRCQQDKRKAVDGEDLLFAMTSLGFENYAEALTIYLSKYRQSAEIHDIHKPSSKHNTLGPQGPQQLQGMIHSALRPGSQNAIPADTRMESAAEHAAAHKPDWLPTAEPCFAFQSLPINQDVSSGVPLSQETSKPHEIEPWSGYTYSAIGNEHRESCGSPGMVDDHARDAKIHSTSIVDELLQLWTVLPTRDV
ncbi:MAG: hypothetical protein Q9213_005552 [Squamulea squamosa]